MALGNSGPVFRVIICAKNENFLRERDLFFRFTNALVIIIMRIKNIDFKPLQLFVFNCCF